MDIRIKDFQINPDITQIEISVVGSVAIPGKRIRFTIPTPTKAWTEDELIGIIAQKVHDSEAQAEHTTLLSHLHDKTLSLPEIPAKKKPRGKK